MSGILFRCFVRGENSVRVTVLGESSKRLGVWYGSRGIWETCVLPGLRTRGTVVVTELKDQPLQVRGRPALR